MSLYETDQYLKNNPGWHEEDSPWKVERILEMLRKHNLTPKDIVDVGCGAGALLSLLQKSLPPDTRLCGYDVAPTAIGVAEKRKNSHLDFVCRDILTTQKRGAELLLLMDVFEHIPDYMGFLTALSGYAKMFIFHIPLDMNLLHLLQDRHIASRDVAGHLHYFSKATGLRTLEDCGYRIVDWTYTRVFETDKAMRSPLKRVLALPRSLGLALVPDLSTKIFGGCSLLVLAVPSQGTSTPSGKLAH